MPTHDFRYDIATNGGPSTVFFLFVCFLFTAITQYCSTLLQLPQATPAQMGLGLSKLQSVFEHGEVERPFPDTS